MLSFLNLLKTNRPILNILGAREYAARKGTRERKAKLKKKRKEESKEKVVVKKVYGRPADLVHVKQRPFDDSHYSEPIDDVYFHRKFRKQEYSFRDVVQFHRETHHETVYNQPTAPLMFRVDIDLRYPNRPNKCMDPWKSLVELRAPFLLEGTTLPTVIAFCQENADEISATLAAGADVAGGSELIKAVQDGTIKTSDFDYVIAHPLVITELTAIRGLMKKQFPTVRSKTIGVELGPIVKRLKSGVKIKLNSSNQEPDFGYLVACAGMLNMPVEDLEANFSAYIEDTLSKKLTTKEAEDFILQCHAYTDFSFEKLRINWKQFLPSK